MKKMYKFKFLKFTLLLAATWSLPFNGSAQSTSMSSYEKYSGELVEKTLTRCDEDRFSVTYCERTHNPEMVPMSCFYVSAGTFSSTSKQVMFGLNYFVNDMYIFDSYCYFCGYFRKLMTETRKGFIGRFKINEAYYNNSVNIELQFVSGTREVTRLTVLRSGLSDVTTSVVATALPVTVVNERQFLVHLYDYQSNWVCEAWHNDEVSDIMSEVDNDGSNLYVASAASQGFIIRTFPNNSNFLSDGTTDHTTYKYDMSASGSNAGNISLHEVMSTLIDKENYSCFKKRDVQASRPPLPAATEVQDSLELYNAKLSYSSFDSPSNTVEWNTYCYRNFIMK